MEKLEIIYQKWTENEFKSNELDLINKAYKLLEGFNINPQYALNIAEIVANLNADANTIAAPFIYDIVLENKMNIDDVNNEFGEDIAGIIQNLLKMDNLKLNDYNESSSIYLRKVLVGISEDVRVLIIKLAMRVEDMRNCMDYPDNERKQIINETMNVLIPIAHRLGINTIKSELEDLCLRYSKPEVYNEILEKLTYGRIECTKISYKSGVSLFRNSWNLNIDW